MLLTDSILNDFINYFPNVQTIKGNSYVENEDDKVIFYLQLPGYSKKDLSIKLKDGNIEVSSDVEDEKLWKTKFKRLAIPPKDSDLTKIKAKLENGILEIMVPKKESATKEIKID